MGDFSVRAEPLPASRLNLGENLSAPRFGIGDSFDECRPGGGSKDCAVRVAPMILRIALPSASIHGSIIGTGTTAAS